MLLAPVRCWRLVRSCWTCAAAPTSSTRVTFPALCVPRTRALRSTWESYPEAARILVNCKSGGRSSRAVAYLQAHGFKATNLAGGFDAWAAAGGASEPTKPASDVTPKPVHPHAATR